MLILDSIKSEKWYPVVDVSEILGWSVDTIRDWIDAGQLQAFLKPKTVISRNRRYRCMQIQGCEIIRFVKENLTPLNAPRKLITKVS